MPVPDCIRATNFSRVGEDLNKHPASLMAIFIDSQKRHYIGILYVRDDDIYSGNFVLPSPRAVRWLDKLLLPMTYLLSFVLVVCVVAFAIELALGPLEFFNYFFAATSAIGIAVMIPYLFIGPLILSRTRRDYQKIRLRCLTDLSMRMYLLPLMIVTLVAASVIFMPAFSFPEDGMFHVVVLGPIFIGLLFAVLNYSWRRN